MKIQTDRKGWFGQTIGLGDYRIEFNGEGVADVSNEVGAEVLERYKSMIYIAGKLPQKEESVQVKINENEVKELLNQVERLQRINDDQKEEFEKKIEVLENEVSSWKKEFEKAKSKSGETVNQVVSDKEFEALAGLIDQNVNDLKKFSIEKLGMDQASVEPLRKPQLVVEIFKSILNAGNA